jgi:predicted GNAT family acetyltransferase
VKQFLRWKFNPFFISSIISGVNKMETIRHIPEQHRFVIDYNGAEAILQYVLSVDKEKTSIDFNSTFVPPAFRGKGLAEKLVRTGIKWAKEQGYELHASCWYAAKFIR